MATVPAHRRRPRRRRRAPAPGSSARCRSAWPRRCSRPACSATPTDADGCTSPGSAVLGLGAFVCAVAQEPMALRRRPGASRASGARRCSPAASRCSPTTSRPARPACTPPRSGARASGSGITAGAILLAPRSTSGPAGARPTPSSGLLGLRAALCRASARISESAAAVAAADRRARPGAADRRDHACSSCGPDPGPQRRRRGDRRARCPRRGRRGRRSALVERRVPRAAGRARAAARAALPRRDARLVHARPRDHRDVVVRPDRRPARARRERSGPPACWWSPGRARAW